MENLNYEKLKEFILVTPDNYWDERSISLEKLGLIPSELTMEELEQLLDEVQLIENDLYEEINEREYSIKIWYDYRADECYYLLVMKWI